jgi:hypothetical protein
MYGERGREEWGEKVVSRERVGLREGERKRGK